jgi:hypothetical protein
MKIDSVHAEFMSGNAVSSTSSSHSIVSRDATGDIAVAGVTIAGNSGTLFSYSDGTRSMYGGCDSNDPWFGTSSNHDLRLVTNSGVRMRIDKTGNVGIGTESPDEKLEVRGNVKISNNDTEAMYIDKGGTIRRSWYDSGTNSNMGSGFHFTNDAIWPTNYAGTYNNGGITFGHSSYPWRTVYTKDVNAKGGIVYCDPNTATVNSPTSTGIDVNNTSSGDATITLRVKDSNAGDPFISFDIASEYGWSMGIDNDDSNKFKLARTWHNINSSTALTVTTDGNFGIGTTSPNYKLHIVGSDTDANATYSTMVIDHNCSGSDACTDNRSHTGLLIDMDSTATGGTTSNEHRIYGIKSDVRHSGDSDLVYSIYGYARSDHTSGTTTYLRAGDFYAVASGTGTNTNIYGINSFAYKDASSTGTTANMYGVRGEVQLNGGECTTAYVFQSQIDHNAGTMDTAYLYYGSYSGTVSTKWGIYLTGETKNYFSGDVGIGNTTPSYKLDVNGDINVASGKKFRMNGTALANSAMIAADDANTASRIVLRDGNGNFSAGTITATLDGTASECSGNAAYATSAGNAGTVGSLGTSSFLRADVDTECSNQLKVTGYNNDSVSAITDRYFIATKYLHANWSIGEDEFPSYNTSIRASYYISGDGLLATSDERAKTEIQTLDTEIALSKLEKIRPVSYKMKHTGQFTFGFIGQEIEKELPNVVNKDMGYISDLNIMGVFSNKQSTKYQGKDGEKDAFVYTLTLDVPIPSTFDVNLTTYIETACVNEGSTAEFFYDPEYCDKPETGGTVMKLLSEKDNVKEGVSYKIIGTLVNDFRSLDYNEIFTVTTAALKEVNDQLKAEKIKTADLTARVEDLEAMVSIIKLNMTWPDA